MPDYYQAGFWAPEWPRGYDLFGKMRNLCRKPVVYLANLGAGNVDNGPHRWKVYYSDAGGSTLPGEKSIALTTSAGNGQVVIVIPPFPAGATHANVVRNTVADAATFLLVNGSPLAKATYELKPYVDNVADAGLGAAAPVTNDTTTPVDDPETGQGILLAMAAGEDLNLLVAYFVCQYRWVMHEGKTSNVMVLVPGTWSYDSVPEFDIDVEPDWPYYWLPDDATPSEAATPDFNSWCNMGTMLDAAVLRGISTEIYYGNGVTYDYEVKAIVAGQVDRELGTNDETVFVEMVCKAVLMAVMNLD